MKLKFDTAPTSLILRVKLMDSSASDGSGLTGLAFGSAGLIISTIQIGEATATVYTQAAGNIETVSTLGTYAAPTASKCRFKEVDATNHPGVYEIHIADARFASTAQVIISITGATDLAEQDIEIQIEAVTVTTNSDKTGYTASTVSDKTGYSLAAAQEVQLNAQGKTDVNTEVADVLTTDTQSEESAGAPTATPTIKEMLMYLYMKLRNKQTQTASEQTITNNAGTTIAKAATSDDGTTFTKDEYGAP